MRGATENVRVHPMQHGTDQNARGHQNDHVGYVREVYERRLATNAENEKAAKKSKK